ncbi:MAG TPA: hypothetical protein VKR30_09025, partial [Candidatus Limnocylindrales bacterium]|nr:hypothetical protein [Candidatus Limnocylindrales bacterium]
MAGIWVVAETNPDGSLARSSSELGTLGRTLAEASGVAATGIVVAADPDAAAAELATYLPAVIAIPEPAAADHAWGQLAAERAAAVIDASGPTLILASAGPDGRDVAGSLLALLDGAALVNATAVAWSDGESVEMSVFGGKLITISGFVDGTG